MENLGLTELIIDREFFNSGWHKNNICGWCFTEIYQTEKSYHDKGNICQQCNTKINNIHMANIKLEQEKRKEEKRKQMDKLGDRLEEDLTEEERISIVEEMYETWSELRHGESI